MLRCLISLMMLFYLSSTVAQDQLSLSQAIQLGLENNYQIQIAETQLDIANNSNDWAIAGRYPTVDFVVSSNNGYNYQNNPVSFLPEISSVRTGITPSVEAQLTLFDGYRVRVTKQQLRRQEELSEADLAIAVENTIQNIMLAYYQALLEQERLDVRAEVMELSRDRIEYDEARKEFGQAVTFDLLQTRDAYLNDSTNYLLQQNTFDNALRNLNRAMGIDDRNRRFRLTDSLQAPEDNYALPAMQERMLANNRQLRRSFVNRELASIGTRLEEANLYPSLNLSSSASYDVSLSNGSGTTATGETREIDAVAARTFNFGIGFTARYRLLDWGVRRRNIENAQLQEIVSQYNVDNLKRDLRTQLANTYATYLNQQRIVEVAAELLRNAAQNIDIAEERFRGGLINSFDFRQVQVSYLNAAQSQLQAIFNLKSTEIELIRLTGGLVRE